jgi:ATP-dependent protease ClpP protease subunit
MTDKKLDIDDDIPGSGTKKFSTAISAFHEFYLSGEILDPEEYIDWFQVIRHAKEGDVVKIYINSGGGNVDTAIQFLRVLSETQATVITSIEGCCASAATMIFLQGHQMEISDHSVIMFHNYAGGSIGKGGEMYDQIAFERKWSKGLLESVYNGILTEKEIESMLDNKDIWMDGKELMERISAKAKAQQSEQ